MNHNKHNLKFGQTVILDKGTATECEVIIVDFTPNEVFATVRWYGNTDTWEVMTARLSPKTESK